MSEPIRVLIVDDNSAYRRGLRELLKTVPDLQVVAEAASGEEALAQVSAAQPDVVLMDLAMPGMTGIEATSKLVAARPHLAILMLTMFENDESVLGAIRAGARGYLLKDSPRADLARSILLAARGGMVLGPGVRRGMLAQAAPVAAQEQPFPQLSSRESEVLLLVGQGLSNGEIADRMLVAEKTVRNYVSSIYDKLGVTTRGAAIVKALSAGPK